MLWKTACSRRRGPTGRHLEHVGEPVADGQPEPAAGDHRERERGARVEIDRPHLARREPEGRLLARGDVGRAVRERAESDGDELVRQAAERLVLKHHQLLVPTFMVRV